MGDMSELRGIIVAGSLIALTVFLMVMIPHEFLVVTSDVRTIETDEYFTAVDLERYGDYFNHTMNGTDADLYQPGFAESEMYYRIIVEVGGHTLDIYYSQPNGTVYSWVFGTFHCETYGVAPLEIIVNKHNMVFYYEGLSQGIQVDRNELNAASDLKYEMSCNHLNLDVFFYYNTTRFATPVEAFDHGELVYLIGVTWDEMQTSLSAWDLVALILLFQLPDVHWIINAAFAVPVYLCMIYIAVVMILKVLDVIIPL